MSSTLMMPALGCVLQIADIHVARHERTWVEDIRLEVGADPGCTHIDIPLPPAVTVTRRGGRIVLGDGRRSRLDGDRFSMQARSLDGRGALRLYLPDLIAGDRAIIALQRVWNRPDAYTWRPEGARWAELTSRDTSWSVQGADHDARKGTASVELAGPDVQVILSTSDTTDWTNPYAGLRDPTSTPQHTRALSLEVPTVDPQRALYPGGGSTVRVTDRLSFQAEEHDRGWLVPARDVSDLSVRVTPSGDAATVEQRSDGLLVVVSGSDGPADVLLDYRLPDAPTYGEVPSHMPMTIAVPGGHIRWQDGRFWSLIDVHQRPILPTHEALIKALDRRFRRAAIPEPGLPSNLRGRKATWALGEELVPTLHARARPAPLDVPALLPRPLARARRSGVLTEVEAGLITWLYGLQARLESNWLLVRSAESGPGGAVNLAGFEHMLVQIGRGDSARWLDPSCSVCGPWEVRPELEGADVLALPGVTGPKVNEGQWTVVVQPEQVAWEARGPAALVIRRSVAHLPRDERLRALAQAVSGPGGELLEARGLEPGGPLTLLSRRGDGPVPLPLDLPPPRGDGRTWVPWLGTRTLHLDDPSAHLPEPYDGETVALTVVDRTVILIVKERHISAADAAAIHHAARVVRTAAAVP